MSYTIALAGNTNCGKTSLFNELTGSKQHVGNWPGVTVDKKEGTYKKDSQFMILDLPGTYSLSPYSAEEVIARDYIVNEKPDCVINIIDSKNLAEGKKLNDIWRIHILFPFTDGPGFYFQAFLIQKISKLQLIQMFFFSLGSKCHTKISIQTSHLPRY